MSYVYFFAEGRADGNAKMKEVLGGKGANLAEMANLGIPVPPGFTISAEVCRYYYTHSGEYPSELREEVEENLRKLEKVTGSRFGDPKNPLLVSVRSGAAISMPGMMDTVLNVGLNEKAVEGLIEKTGNERFCWDAYRRLIQMFGNVVKKIEHARFDDIMERFKKEKGVELDTELDAEDLKRIIEEFKRIYKEELQEGFPEAPTEQLWQTIDAVFGSWNNPRAIKYREISGISDEAMGTAVNVQAMVFGNMGDDSATGVAFTRNPATGEKELYGEYLRNAQGEDVVAGIRTPKDIRELEHEMPQIYSELKEIFNRLEQRYRDIQDVEFTIEQGKLYMLQTRAGKRTGLAALNIAMDMYEEGLVDEHEALTMVEPEQLVQLLAPVFEPEAKEEAKRQDRLLAGGLNASPGAACGRVVFTSNDAARTAQEERVILVRHETSAEDIQGMHVAQGFLTSRGGFTSHAAIVGRGMGKPAVVGCEEISIDYANKLFRVDSREIKEGEYISIDGTTGEIFAGEIPTQPSEILQVVLYGTLAPEKSKLYQKFETFMGWADEVRGLGVRTNADTPEDAELARKLGAEGIGLARTEHMFFGAERLPLFQEAIIAQNAEERRRPLEKLAEAQKEDFKGLLKAMEGLPVIIRLLDPPLHEFLPHEEAEIERLAHSAGIEPERLKERIQGLEEFNPMLGHRGCRLGITTPEIYQMQAEAIIKAACELKSEGVDVKPRIMVPLVGHINEIKLIKQEIKMVAQEVMKALGVQINYKVGTMIEVPRACITADEIAQEAEFFSFGTNDLTQMAFGFSRDDAGRFLGAYNEHGILAEDPFQTVDQRGVGELMKLAVRKGREARKDLSIGICGEHGGDSKSITFCHQVSLDYVSCSPYRVPIARLAAAQAALKRSEAESRLRL